jgi:hypothetical protein
MKNFWKRYWEWSDKINAPFREHKDRILLYITLCQSVIITVALFRLVSGMDSAKMEMVCKPNFTEGTMYCIEK